MRFESLTTVLKDEERRPSVIDDCAEFIDEEVKAKKGFSGTLIKGGYAVVKRLNKGRMIHEVLEGLLDDFAVALEPIHGPYRDARAEGKEKGFDETLVAQKEEATDALLGVTDERAERGKHKVILKTYRKLRPKAAEHVKAALPGLGKLIDRHTEISE